MTEYTNRKGMTDYYDENVVKTVLDNANLYIARNRKMPTSVGVDHNQMAELKKAEEAGVQLVVACGGKTERIHYQCSDSYYRPRNVPNREENKDMR